MKFLGVVAKMKESSLFLRKPSNITVIQVYAPASNAEEAEVEWSYEDGPMKTYKTFYN